MTITLAELQADREAGTRGPWKADGPDPFGDYNVIFSDNENDCRAILAVVSNLRCPGMVAANARRAARLPELEAALIEAVGVLKEARDTMRWLEENEPDALGWHPPFPSELSEAKRLGDKLQTLLAKLGADK